MNSSIIFLTILLLSLIVQGTLWHTVTFTDEDVWLKRVEKLDRNISDKRYQADNPIYSGHPGMAALTIAVVARKAGSSLTASLKGSATLLISLTIAGVATLCYLLRPKSLWWIAASAMILFHPLYYSASPTNAVIAPLAVFITLLALWIYENHQHQHLYHAMTMLGITIGVASTTRLVTTIFIVFPFLLFLSPKLGWRKITWISAISIITTLFFDPLALNQPWQHLKYIIFRSSLNLTNQVPSIDLTPTLFIIFAPLSIISIFFATATLTSKNNQHPVIPLKFIALLLFLTILLGAIFLNVRAQSLRHFLPIIFIWEALLPLFLLHLVNKMKFSSSRSIQHANALKKASRYSAVSLLIGGQLFLLLFTVLF